MAVSQLLVSMELFLNINTGNVIHMYWTTINIVLISCPLYSFIIFLNKRGNSISRTISTLFLTLEIPFLLHLMQMTDSNLSLTYVFCPWRSMRTYFSVFPHFGAVWYVCLKTENYCLKTFMKIRVGEKVHLNT